MMRRFHPAFPSIIALLALPVLALVMAMSACKRTKKAPVETEWARFTGSALSSDEVTTATVIARTPALAPLAGDEFRQTTFEARARAALPTAAASLAQREAFARAESRRAALRLLADRILIHQPGGSGVNLSVMLESGAEGRATLEGVVESTSSVAYQTGPDSGDLEAHATIRGGDIARAVFDSQLAALRSRQQNDKSSLTPEARKAAAETAALDAARAAAHEAVMALRSNFGTMAEIVEKHPEAGIEIQNWINSLQPEQARHSPGGLCETTVKLDIQKAYGLIKKFASPLPSAPAPQAQKKKSGKGADKKK